MRGIVSSSGLEDPIPLGEGWDDADRTASERLSDPNLSSGVAPAPDCVVCDDWGCEFCGATDRSIPVYRGRGRNKHIARYALVSSEDYERLAAYEWHLGGHGYAQRREGAEKIYMHREVLGLTKGDGVEVDHLHHDKLDNRRRSLRTVTHAENAINRTLDARNKSGYRGVYWDESRDCWCAQTAVGGKTIGLGRFESRSEAIAAATAGLRLARHFVGDVD